MRHKILALLGLVLSALLLGACRSPVAFTVNGEPVRVAEVERLAALAGTSPDDERLLEQIIAEQLLLQAARAQGIAIERNEVERQLEQRMAAAGGRAALQRELAARGQDLSSYRHDLETRLLVLRYLDGVTAAAEVADDEVRAAYERELPHLIQPEQWGVTLLRYRSPTAARAAYEELLAATAAAASAAANAAASAAANAAASAGADHEAGPVVDPVVDPETDRAAAAAVIADAVAKALPGSGDALLGGSETGPQRRALLEAARTTELFRPSEPVLLADGSYLVVPTRYYPPLVPRFEELEPNLRAALQQRAEQQLLAEHLAALRADAEVDWQALRPSPQAAAAPLVPK